MTNQVRTRLEVFGEVSVALSRCTARLPLPIDQADVHATRALKQAGSELSRREAALAQARAALAAATEEEAAQAAQVVRTCEEASGRARRVVREIETLAETQRRRARSLLHSASELTQSGQSSLRSWEGGLEIYLSRRAGTGSSGERSQPTAHNGSSDGLAEIGLTMVPVDAATFADNPIRSWDKASREDIAWAVERWDSVVSKVVARGGGLAELEDRDRREGAKPGSMRELSRAYECFTGGDRIRVEPRGDGTYGVIGGRHRLQVAKELGVHSLPVEIVR